MLSDHGYKHIESVLQSVLRCSGGNWQFRGCLQAHLRNHMQPQRNCPLAARLGSLHAPCFGQNGYGVGWLLGWLISWLVGWLVVVLVIVVVAAADV